MDAKDLDDARMRYHFALAPEDYERLPFYSALLHLLENDALALELLAGVRVEQRNPMLILATLQFVALGGHEVLGPLYEEARHAQLGDCDEAARRVLEVMHETPELVGNELWRSTQTNEPGRSAVLQAVISDLVAEVTSAVNVIEVGTSAGINLCFDQFPVRAKDDGNPLTLICEDLTPIDRSRAMPKVASRVGIDPHPLDLASEDDRRWLKACLWPEERRRHERFDAIVEARPSWPNATILTGSALERMNDAFALKASNELTIVFNTWVVFYFTPEERTNYFNELIARCATNNVAWISIESTLVTLPGVEVDEEARHRGASQIVVTRPGSSPTRWGWCHAHGRWLEQTTPS
ncbi:MAG TPA: DUF2332 domain-containing protein [Acidimicrobiales bacterium]|nr:DUF2332 domain-containing protein [Acidimicrobiales bacterium]